MKRQETHRAQQRRRGPQAAMRQAAANDSSTDGSATDGSARERMTREARRAYLLDCAAQILLEKIPGGVTMESLAERAGVSKGLGYAHFRDAEDVLLALVDHEMDALVRRVSGAVADAAGFEQFVAAAIGAYFDVAGSQGGHLLGILRARLTHAGFEKEVMQRLAPYGKFISQRIRAEFGTPDKVAETLAAMAAGVANSAIAAWARQRIPRAEVEQRCVRMVVAGIRAAVAAP